MNQQLGWIWWTGWNVVFVWNVVIGNIPPGCQFAIMDLCCVYDTAYNEATLLYDAYNVSTDLCCALSGRLFAYYCYAVPEIEATITIPSQVSSISILPRYQKFAWNV